MAKLALLLSLAIVLSLGQLSLCQPDCSALDVDFTGAATSGEPNPPDQLFSHRAPPPPPMLDFLTFIPTYEISLY